MGRSAPSRVHYAWTVLAVTFLCLFVAAALRAVPGILLLSLEQEFGWSRPAISGAVAINLLIFGLSGPWLGRWMDIYGPKRVCVVSIALLALAAAACTTVSELWQFYLLWGLIAGIGSGGTSIVLASTLVNRWFRQRRGLAMGILGAAFSSGQLIFMPLVMQINMVFGWRPAILLLAGLLGWIVLPLCAWLLADEPRRKGLRAYGESGAESADSPSELIPMRKVVVQGPFWLLAISFAICGFTTSGLFQTHLIPHGIEHGFNEMTMAMSLGLMGATDIVGTLLSGWLCDRFNHRNLLASYYALRGISLLSLPYVETTEQLMLFSVVYGLNWLSTVPVTSALTADLFGKRNVGVVFGWICCAHQFGAASASYSAGYLHSVLGNYHLAFLGAGVFALSATLIVVRVRG
ncbi:MFS transporter [Methylomonas methanica]|uniref:MFS transporter n=1 Tax=Methylomonas methanica TaxID=421 RepID=A0A177MNR7_METMH|nr:MFS transporter [Methylomonas methanica]OAI07301.1 MFS transporter [Methylomonas methanica]